MKAVLPRVLSDYGMILVLLLLCAFFSVVTYRDQSPTGAAAGRQLATTIMTELGEAPRVLIAVRDQPDDVAMAEQLRRDVEEKGGQVLAVVQGEPKDARAAIQKLAAANSPIDVIACTQSTGAWLVFQNLDADFPALGKPRIMTPRTYYWPSFLKTENLLNIANQNAVIAIVAIGMTMVIITGGIDLSVGSLLALSSVLAARFIRDFGGGVEASPMGMIVACAAAVVVCGMIGAFSGTMITRFGIPSFIVTLAIMLIGSGLAYITSAGQSIFQVPGSFIWLGRGANLFGLPNAVVLMVILYALAHVLMSQMRLGRYLYAVGGNREAARLSGVPVERVITFAYIASALLAGLGGVIMASQLKSGSPTYGSMYELYVIAAVVVGGTSLSGGEGKILGTLIGAFIMAVIQNGMNLTNIESYTQRVVLGLVILGAGLIDRLRHA
jgi:ribose transport system permease protein